MTRTRLDPTWGETIYVDDDSRYIVSLVVGYSEDDLNPTTKLGVSALDDHVAQAEDKMTAAAAAALELTRDGESSGTRWYVYDRLTGIGRLYEQGDFEL